MSKVIAMRAGVTKPFSARSWALMPRDKYGWVEVRDKDGWVEVRENLTPPDFVSAEIEARRALVIESKKEQYSPAPKKGRKPKKYGISINK